MSTFVAQRFDQAVIAVGSRQACEQACAELDLEVATDEGKPPRTLEWARADVNLYAFATWHADGVSGEFSLTEWDNP